MEFSKKRGIKRKPLWRIYRESGDVHQDLTVYTPIDVEKTDDVLTLMKIYNLYTLTGFEWNWKTEYYMRVMSLRALKKLTAMGFYPPYFDGIMYMFCWDP